MTTRWDDIRGKLAAGVRKVRPVTQAVESVAKLAVQMRAGLTPLGALGLASTAVNSLEGWLSNPPSPTAGYDLGCSPATICAALSAAGWEIKAVGDDGTDFTHAEHGAVRVHRFNVSASSSETVAAIIGALDRFLPAAVRISRTALGYHDAPAVMTHYDTDDGALIARTLALHADDGPRCVLLHGDPGTGKSTLAREIVHRLAIGRAVWLHESAIDSLRTEWLACLTPRVLVVDDIDKLRLSLSDVEALRAAAPVVILTANNGELAEVIDGALIRPGRIDETFAIVALGRPPAPPFHLLPPEVWDEVKLWAPAYLNELGLRLERRGLDGARIDDLRERVGRPVRSRDILGPARAPTPAAPSPPRGTTTARRSP